MSHALVGQWQHLGWIAAKAVLLFVVAVIGLRVAARRTLAELSVFDFVTAVAVGAVVGRVPNASGTSFVAGAVTLVVLLAAHNVVGRIRINASWGRALDHRPIALISGGVVDEAALRRRQLSDDDLASLLRARGVTDLAEVDWAIYEPGGALSVVRRGQRSGGLVRVLVGACE